MEQGNSSYASRLQRSMRERVRRSHMKDLLSELAFLIPVQSSKVSAPKLLEQATSYIKHLQERIEEQSSRRQALLKESTSAEDRKNTSDPRLPVLDMRCLDNSLEINLICGLNKNFMLHEIISILQEEGAEIISASQFDAGDRLVYLIKSQAISPRIGIDATRVRQRIKDVCF